MDRLSTKSFVKGSSGTEEVISRREMVKVHLLGDERNASIYDSCLKSLPERRIGMSFTYCRLYYFVRFGCDGKYIMIMAP